MHTHTPQSLCCDPSLWHRTDLLVGSLCWRSTFFLPSSFSYLCPPVNWNPDDCLAEAIIPLWGFFEVARRELEKEPGNVDKQVRRIPRQWVHMTHPQNSDQGEVEIEIELLPMEIADAGEFKAAKGFDGFKAQLNGPSRVLAPPNRPDDSFPWYRLDLQILWRCKYIWKKARWSVTKHTHTHTHTHRASEQRPAARDCNCLCSKRIFRPCSSHSFVHCSGCLFVFFFLLFFFPHSGMSSA